jgi:hypothetical protein
LASAAQIIAPDLHPPSQPRQRRSVIWSPASWSRAGTPVVASTGAGRPAAAPYRTMRGFATCVVGAPVAYPTLYPAAAAALIFFYTRCGVSCTETDTTTVPRNCHFPSLRATRYPSQQQLLTVTQSRTTVTHLNLVDVVGDHVIKWSITSGR